MKKTFLVIALAATMISCSKDEVVSKHQEVIGFDKTFVNNSTRSVSDPSFSSAEDGKMFSDFAVFGFVEGAVLFDGTQVSKNISNDELTSDWKYSGTQYWIAGASYNFNAVAPKTDGGWEKTAATKDATTLSFTNNGTTDLLYAYATQQGKVSGNETVNFTFRHVLSKVKFSFTNNYDATNATIRVKNILITDAYQTGNVVLDANTAWSDQANNKLLLVFGNAATSAVDAEETISYTETVESYNELLLIPGEGATTNTDTENNVTKENLYTVKFTVELLVSNSVVATYQHTIYTTFAPEAGKSYDIAATITPENIDPNHAQEPIEFTVSTLPGWGDTNDVNIPDNQ